MRGYCILRGVFIGNLFAVLRINVGKKDSIVEFTPAVIIPVIELALNRDERTKTHAAFPAPVTVKRDHDK
jgi:hypothetical protein